MFAQVIVTMIPVSSVTCSMSRIFGLETPYICIIGFVLSATHLIIIRQNLPLCRPPLPSHRRTECSPGHVCFQRSADELVPGCYGLAVTDRDYCYDPNYVPVAGGPVPSPTTASVPEPAPVAAPVALPTLPAMGNLDVIGDCDGDDGDFCGLCIGDCDDDGDVSYIVVSYMHTSRKL